MLNGTDLQRIPDTGKIMADTTMAGKFTIEVGSPPQRE